MTPVGSSVLLCVFHGFYSGSGSILVSLFTKLFSLYIGYAIFTGYHLFVSRHSNFDSICPTGTIRKITFIYFVMNYTHNGQAHRVHLFAVQCSALL